MRASDRDREQAVALLRARCVEGYLSVETFEYRLGRALAARTALELRLLLADIGRVRRRWRLPRAAPAPLRLRTWRCPPRGPWLSAGVASATSPSPIRRSRVA